MEKQEQQNKFFKSIMSKAYIVVITLIFLNNYSKIYDKKIDLNGDNSSYYSLGKAISEGNGYVNPYSQNEVKANHFPPGYSFFIATVMNVVNDNISTIKVANGVLFLLSTLIFYFLIYRMTDNEHLGFAVAILMLVNLHLLTFSTIMMSEHLFVFLMALCLLLMQFQNKEKPLYKDIYFYLIILCSTAAYYTRTAGLSMIGAFFLSYIFAKDWKRAFGYIASFILFALPWYLRSKSLGGNSYTKQLMLINPYNSALGEVGISDMFTRFFNNLSRYITVEIPNATFGIEKANYQLEATSGDWIWGVFLLSLLVLGIFALKKYKLFFTLFALSTGAILTLWPDVWFGPRFILPVVPIIIFFIANGVQFVLSKLLEQLKIAPDRLKLIVPLFFLLIALSQGSKVVAGLEKLSKSKYPPAYKNFFSISKKVKTIAKSDVVVCSRKPNLYYLYGKTFATNYKYSANTQEVIQHMIDNNVDYVILEQLGYGTTGKYLYPTIQKNPDKFELIYQLKNPDTYLFKFNP